MPRYYAKAELKGTIGKEPEYNTTKGGTHYVKFTLAVNHSKKVGDRWEDDGVSWFNITMFGKSVEYVKDFNKGSHVVVECSIKDNKWNDKVYKNFIGFSITKAEGMKNEPEPSVPDDDLPF